MAKPEEFAVALKKMHPQSYPVTFETVAFEVLLGQKALNVYGKGQNGGENFFYRLTMVGTRDTGYATGGFYRIESLPPFSGLIKPLK
jgi:hypothetical protein